MLSVSSVVKYLRHHIYECLYLGKGFFKMPLKKLKAGGAEIGLFKICILDPGWGKHNTSPVSAMGDAECVAQFMQYRLFHPFQ